MKPFSVPSEDFILTGRPSDAIGWAALALARTMRTLHALESATALTMEGFLFNPSVIDPAVFQAYPSPGLKLSVLRLRKLLDGGAILAAREKPRLLQDPLSLRVAPQAHGSACDAWSHTVKVVEIELAAASQSR